MVQDLNNLLYFARIVEYGSLSRASAELGVSKSVLSEHLARLEQDLGVRLIQRSTRRMQITELGRRYYRRCRAVLLEAERADRVIEEAHATPRGSVRMVAPINFAQGFLASVLADFMVEYPAVEVLLEITNREVDLIAGGYDVVLRIAPVLRSSSLVVRTARVARHILVASPALLAGRDVASHPQELSGWPSVAGVHGVAPGTRHVWELSGPDGESLQLAHAPRFLSEDIFVLKHAAIAGCGIAELPPVCCRDELESGALLRVLPAWSLPQMHLHMMFASRDGLSPAVRCCVDYLSEHLLPGLEVSSIGRMRVSLSGGDEGVPAATLR